ncbi:MAG: O-antigen ligase family protein [candidate division KSB1 bacterium]
MRQYTNAPLFLAILIFGSAFFILGRTKMESGTALLITMFFALALIITFARGYWIAAALGVLAIFWLLPARDKTRMTIYFGILTLITIGVVFIFFGDLAEFFLKTISSRFHTVGGAVQDKSFANRLAEWQAVFAQIKANPVLGYGLGKTYSYNALIPIEMPTWYVHNTFLFVWYKIGLFGLIALVLFLAGMLARGLHIYRTNNDKFLKAFSLGLVGCIIALVVVSFSSPQFIEKDSSLLGALIGGIIQAVSARGANKTGETSYPFAAQNRQV